MLTKPFSEINAADLQCLIDNGVPESKTIEYKRELNIDSSDSKRKFLASIASFANASGGDLIFGMEAEEGIPKKFFPLISLNSDEMKLKLTNIIRDGIQPKVFGMEMKEIPNAGGHAFFIRIPKTYSGAHMVVFNGDNRFYARGTNGKLMMDVHEIKAAFTLADTTMEKVKNWRMERIANILADETPCKLNLKPRVVMHLIPLRAFDPTFKPELNWFMSNRQHLIPINSSGWDYSMDLDGVFCFCGQSREDGQGYTYVLRNGCIEAVDGTLLQSSRDQDLKLIPSGVLESKLIEYWKNIVEIIKQCTAEPPFFISMSLLGVKGYKMSVVHRYSHREEYPIARDNLNLPLTFLETLPESGAEVLRESFNLIWNACGWPGSINYDENKRWNPK